MQSNAVFIQIFNSTSFDIKQTSPLPTAKWNNPAYDRKRLIISRKAKISLFYIPPGIIDIMRLLVQGVVVFVPTEMPDFILNQPKINEIYPG